MSVDIETMLEEVNYLKPYKDESQFTTAITAFYSYISSRKPLTIWIRYGSKYAHILLSFSKISFTIVSFAQLYYLDRFIGNSSQLFGVEVLSRMWHGESLSEWSIFPRDAICNFNISREESPNQFSVCWDNSFFYLLFG